MRLSLGYPDALAERALLAGTDRRELLAKLSEHGGASLNTEQLLAAQAAVRAVHVSEALLDYVQAWLRATREHPQLQHGLSPRAGLALLQAARAWAWLSGREFVQPEDVQAVCGAVITHRLKPRGQIDSARVVQELLQQIPVFSVS
jgi:MoxR-like ATPase